MIDKWVNPESKVIVLGITLAVGIPMFLLSTIDYTFLWRYVGWTNQLSATIMLWTAVSFLMKAGKNHYIAGIPALFMTGVVCTYIFYAPEGLNMDYTTSIIIGSILTAGITAVYVWQIIRHKKIGTEDVALK